MTWSQGGTGTTNQYGTTSWNFPVAYTAQRIALGIYSGFTTAMTFNYANEAEQGRYLVTANFVVLDYNGTSLEGAKVSILSVGK